MMDRLKLALAQSMGFFSTIMKTATINHNTVDLNEFTCGPRTIGRSRNKNRGVLFQLDLDNFKGASQNIVISTGMENSSHLV